MSRIVIKIRQTGPQGPPGLGLPTGGAVGEVLVKGSGVDYDAVWGAVAGTGDMIASVYDPTGVEASAFDMDNMSEGTTNKILTADERTVLDNTSGTNTGDQDLSGLLPDTHLTDFTHSDIAHTNRSALDLVSGTNTGDQDLSGLLPDTHLTDFTHSDIAHTNRAALDLVSGTNTGDQDLSGLLPDTHLTDFTHSDIAHTNRAALDLVSGTNTGDQDLSGLLPDTHLTDFTHSDIAHTNRSALDLVSGTNTGDQDLSGLLPDTHLTDFTHSDIAHTNRSALDLVSGTNTGDQDLSGLLPDTHLTDFTHSDIAHTNRSALDLVSGTNTGDQDLSGLLPDTHLTDFTHSDIAHTNRTALDLVSGTNTGDQDLSGLLPNTHLTDFTHSDIAHTNRANLDTIDQDLAQADAVAFDELTTDLVAFDLTAAETVAQGQLAWNADELTLDLGMDTNVTLQLGQEVVYHVQNNSGSPIADGTPVMATGTLGASGRITIAPMDATTHAYEQFYLGIATEAIANGGEGKVTHFGKIRGIDTTGTLSFGGAETWNDGDVLYLDPNNIGYLTNVEPVGLDTRMPIAFVVYANANGTLFSRTMNHDLNHYVPIDQQQLTKDPTGWVDNTAIQVDYDPVARTITLTGDLRYYWRGVLRELTSPWTSSAHDATTDTTYFLYSTDGVNFTWATSVWEFDELMVAFAYYGATNRYGVVEVHGLMPWQTHREFHARQGTYKVSGGGLTDYVLDSTNSADRHPIVAATVLNDEDIYTTLPEWDVTLDGATQFYLDGAGPDTVLTPSASNIVPILGSRPYWNEFTGAVWQQTLMTNNLYMEVYLVGVPAAADADSQEYRYWWVQGQAQGSLAEMQARSALDLNLGILPTITPEFTFLAKIIIRYTAGNWVFSQVDILSGSRAAITAGPAGNYLSTVVSDGTLTGSGTAGDPLSVVPPTQFVRTFTATAANTFAVGEIGFVSAAGTVTKTDADAEATTKGMLVMATAAIAGGASGTFLCIGPQTGLTGLTAGSTYYVSPTTGGITLTPPSGGQFLRVIGHALSTTELYFNPSQTWIETT